MNCSKPKGYYTKALTRDILEKLYIQEQKTLQQIADIYQTSITTIFRSIKRHKILTRKPGDWDGHNINLVGQHIGYFTILSKQQSQRKPCGQKVCMWECRCICGTIKILSTSELSGGHTKSCGCRQYKHADKNNNWSGYKDISGTYWGALNNGAKHRDIEFNVTIEEIHELQLKMPKQQEL